MNFEHGKRKFKGFYHIFDIEETHNNLLPIRLIHTVHYKSVGYNLYSI